MPDSYTRYRASATECRYVGSAQVLSHLAERGERYSTMLQGKERGGWYVADFPSVPALAHMLHTIMRQPRSMVKVQSVQWPSSPSAPPQGAPGGSGLLGTPRKRPCCCQCLGCSSELPPKPPIPPPLTVQASTARAARRVAWAGPIPHSCAQRDIRGQGEQTLSLSLSLSLEA